MRRVPLLSIGVGILVVLASVTVIMLGRSTAARLVSSSQSALTTASGKASDTASASAIASAVPQSTQAAERNAEAIAAAAAPATAMTARISIPRIGIRGAPVYDRGTDAKGIMQIAPGYAVTHYAFSAPLGGGNAVLYGHDDIQGSIFAHLYDLAQGDLINVTVGGQTQVYRVTGHQIVAPTAVGVLAPTPDVRLTIITCWPYNVDSQRWIVSAVKA